MAVLSESAVFEKISALSFALVFTHALRLFFCMANSCATKPVKSWYVPFFY